MFDHDNLDEGILAATIIMEATLAVPLTRFTINHSTSVSFDVLMRCVFDVCYEIAVPYIFSSFGDQE